MPGFDKSGPMAAGAMTGGRRGVCSTRESADTLASGRGYGAGQGCRRGRFFAGGTGRGFGRGLAADGRTVSAPMRAPSPPDELAYLTQEAQNLKTNLQVIQQRIDDLQPKSK